MLFRTESYRRGFAYSSLLSVVDNLLAFVPSVLVAAFFGTQRVTDLYYYSTGLIMLLTAYISNISAAVIIPEYMRLRIQQGSEYAMRFLNTIWIIGGALVLVLALAVLVDPVSFISAISKFPPHALEQNKAILLWAIPLLPLQAAVGSLNDVLHSHKFFTLPMLSSITNRIMVIGALLAGRTRLGIVSMLIGLQISFLLQVLVLVYLLNQRLGWRWGAGLGPVSRETLRNAYFAALGGLASLGASYVPLMLFTGLADGEVTGLNIAQRLVGLPMAFLASQAAAVMGVRMNELFARRDMQSARKTFETSAVLLVMAMSALSSVLWLLARDVITVLYQRGAFDARSTSITASLFGLLVWGLPALGLNALVARIFMAGQRIREAFWCQLIGNVVQMSVIALAVRRWGGNGYPIAWVSFYVIYLIALAPVAGRLFPDLKYAHVLARCGIVLGIAAGTAVLWRLMLMSVWNAGSSLWLRMFTMGPAVMLIVLLLNYRLPFCPEFKALVVELRERLRDGMGHGPEGGVPRDI